jgi:uncharacterized membrane-anchored protein
MFQKSKTFSEQQIEELTPQEKEYAQEVKQELERNKTNRLSDTISVSRHARA